MGLTYQDLLAKIETVLEKKFNDKFQDLAGKMCDLTDTNNKLISINKALIEQNKKLRALLTCDGDNDIGAAITPDAADPVPSVGAELRTHTPTNTKTHYDVLLLSDSIYRHLGTECPKGNYPRNQAIISCFNVGNLSFMKIVCPGARCADLLT